MEEKAEGVTGTSYPGLWERKLWYSHRLNEKTEV